MGPDTAWIASLSPWPEEFGLERMHALLDALGHPEQAYPAVHVVGTNGKSTAVRTIGALLETEGLRAGCYTSPHVSGWGERLDTDDQGFERAVGRVREAAERVGATQFETLTAAALAEFAAREVDVAVVEAGLGGRLDATNVLGEPEWANLVPANDVRIGCAREAAEAFLGRSIPTEVDVTLPGRLERRGPDEIWDGAHTPEGIDWLLERIPDREWIAVCSMLADKDVEAMLERLAPVARAIVATRSSSPRALPAAELAGRARRYVLDVLAIEDPVAAVREARTLGDAVLVTGSLYLLADLHGADLHGARWE